MLRYENNDKGGRPTNIQRAQAFWDEWYGFIYDKLKHTGFSLQSSGSAPPWETLARLVPLTPICGGCRRRILSFNHVSVWYLVMQCQCSEGAALDEINRYRAEELAAAKREAAESGCKWEPQKWFLSLPKETFDRIYQECYGLKAIICKCGKANQLSGNVLKELRAKTGQLTPAEELALYAILLRNSKDNHKEISQECIATNLIIAPGNLSRALKSVEKKTGMYYSARPKSHITKESMGEPRVFFNAPESLDFSAFPVPETKADFKKAEEKRIQSVFDSQMRAGGFIRHHQGQEGTGIEADFDEAKGKDQTKAIVDNIQAAADFAGVDENTVKKWLRAGMRLSRQGFYLKSQLLRYAEKDTS